MPKITTPLPDKARVATGEALQAALADLLDLALVAKQAHWNVLGPHFRAVHLHLDEVVAAARSFSDLVAERAVAIGVSPDGRAASVAETSRLPAIESGWLADDAVVATLTATLAGIVGRLREHITATAEDDPVTQDLFITVAAELEKQHWMFQAQAGGS